MVGSTEGVTVGGSVVGETVGSMVGRMVGNRVGSVLGITVGFTLGSVYIFKKETKIILVHQSRIIYESYHVSSVPSDRTCLGSEVGKSLGTGDGTFDIMGDGSIER